MGRFVKIISLVVAGLAGIVIIAAVWLTIFFDPNDFRDRISTAVREQTGRDLVIAGDISLTLFPWLAVEVGRTELGNAEGFGDEHFLAFENASLSVRILPLILRQQVEVGTASLDGLTVNLAVAPDGTTNWDDLSEGGDAEEPAADGSGGAASIDVASISVTGAEVAYHDASTDSGFSISGFDFETGRIATNSPIDIRAEFDFSATPAGVGGHIAMRSTVTLSEAAEQVSLEGTNVAGALDGIVSGPAEFNFDSRAIQVDTVARSLDPGEMDLVVFGVGMSANVEPFSYAGSPRPVADLRVTPFSLKELMAKLDIAPPATADPAAMESVSFSARAAVGDDAIALTALTMELDQSTMSGSLSVPLAESGLLEFDLGVDSIVLDAYMAPADGSADTADEDAAPVEIPADLIRALNVRGKFRIEKAWLTGMEFSNMQLGVNSSGGKLRLNPLSADFYDGGYSGDVRVDASQAVPFVSTNERIENVNLGSMMKAMYDVDNVTGTINGHFALQGAGRTVDEIQRDLDGTIAIALEDGALEGTDIWYQLRRARALFRQEAPPEPTLPARTEFTSVSASGNVVDGVFNNNDFRADLPFLQLTGGGTASLVSREIDYAMDVRVLDRPEFMAGATEEELADFTETVVPIRITGLMSAPTVTPDIEGIFRAQVEQALDEKKNELRDQLLDRLLGPEPNPEEGDPNAEDVPEEEDPEDKLKRELLKKIFER